MIITEHEAEITVRTPLSRQHSMPVTVQATWIACFQKGANPFPRTFGFIVIEVAREAERAAANVDVVLESIGTSLGRSNDDYTIVGSGLC